MSCPKRTGELADLMAYATGGGTAQRRAALDAHVAECAECRDLVERQWALWQALECWKPLPVPSDFDARLYARIAEDEARGPAWRRWFGEAGRWPLRPLLPVGAATLAMAALFLLKTPSDAPDLNAGNQRIQQRVNIEQVERTLEDMDMLKQLSLPEKTPAQSM